MPRRKNHNNNNNNNHRARGGRGRGHGRGRGRGQGGPNQVQPTTVASVAPPPSRGPRHVYPHPNAEIDMVVQQWAEQSTVPDANRGRNVNRGNGPWRGGTPNSRSGAGMPFRGTDSPRRGDSMSRATGSGRGRGRGRGQGRGRGRGDGGGSFSTPRHPHFGVGVGVGTKPKTMIGKDTPLSELLYSERPLLRPVTFVRAKLTPFLFQNSEEVLEPASPVVDTTETSHASTTGRVSRLLHGTANEAEGTSDSDSESEDQVQNALEEIDFADMAQVRSEVDAIAQSAVAMDQGAHEDKEDIEEVDFADLAAMRAKIDAAGPQAPRGDIVQETFTGIYNEIKDTTQVSSIMGVVDDVSPPLDDSLDKHFIKISDLSNHESLHARDTTVVEDAVPHSSNALPNLPVEEHSLSTTPETPPAGDSPLHPDAPSDDDPHPLFVVDTTPMRPFTGRSASDLILVDRRGHGETLGDQDDERIVYVAPHPRSGCASPVPAIPRVKLPRTSVLMGRSLEDDRPRSPVREDDTSPVPDRDRMHASLEAGAGEEHQLSLASLSLEPTTSTSTTSPAHPQRTKAMLTARKKEMGRQRQRQRKNKRGQLGFGVFGAMMSEARLREEDVKEMQRPRWQTRRKGDSDLDWGTEDEDEGGDEDEDEDEDAEGEDGVDALSNGLGGMEIDPEIDVNAMQGFLKSMSVEGSQFVTIDDIEDEARMRREDEEGQGGPEGCSDSEQSDEEEVDVDEEEEEMFNIEEEILIAESEGDEELSEGSDGDDDELSPQSSFQARLRKVRERSRRKHPETMQEISDEDEKDEDKPQSLPWTRSADDEEHLAHINDLLEENSHILSGRDRKQKKAVFRNLHQGYVEESLDDPELITPVKKKKGKKGKGKQATGYFAAELEAQWAKNRTKKAEYKQERKAAHLRAALDMVPLEARIRRFVEDLGGPTSLALPPMDNGMRKRVHDMADAFGLDSKSSGEWDARYTTLTKTSKTGVKEGELRAVMKRYGVKGYGEGKGEGGGGRGARGNGGRKGRGDGEGGGGGGAKGRRMPRHREGDAVGKEAPKIDLDLEMDVNAIHGFLKSMNAEGSQFVTMDDIEDESRMRREDEEGQGGPEGCSDSKQSDEEEVEVDKEEEEVFNIEEEILIAESEGDKELSEDSDDDELSARSSFQARLRKVRDQSHGRHPETVQEISEDDDKDKDTSQLLPWTRHINDLLEQNSQNLPDHDRKQKAAVHQDYSYYVKALLDNPGFITPVNKKGKKGKGKQAKGHFDTELEAQRAKDRANKAARKQERRAARKQDRQAAHLRAALDMVPLEARIRWFVEDLGGPTSLALPPMDNGMRKRVHDMADAFGLDSKSSGEGDARYTTLTKTSKTGVKEGELRAVMKRYGVKEYGEGKGEGRGGRGARGNGGRKGRGDGEGGGGGGAKGGRMPRHREGDTVGKEAPKIGESNIGFRMLASMGWSEGDRIGGTASVGIEAPLTAIIKTSKLGLGATR